MAAGKNWRVEVSEEDAVFSTWIEKYSLCLCLSLVLVECVVTDYYYQTLDSVPTVWLTPPLLKLIIGDHGESWIR